MNNENGRHAGSCHEGAESVPHVAGNVHTFGEVRRRYGGEWSFEEGFRFQVSGALGVAEGALPKTLAPCPLGAGQYGKLIRIAGADGPLQIPPSDLSYVNPGEAGPQVAPRRLNPET
ncbi:hypothetical protein [Wenzhouxiangella sp. EGI_FJ10409]|uniref:hypothetical protein n=1 Tax=Wenzhouxiangella sp. EGI_FJ10409 TaxID=3243767 RepID=UPI0035E0EB8F